MVQRAFIDAANIHAWATANRLKPLQHLNRRSGIIIGCGGGGRAAAEQVIGHGYAIGSGESPAQARAQSFENRLWIFRFRPLTNPWSTERHGRRGAAHTARKLRLIGTAAMFDAIRKARVYRHTAEMEIRLTRVAKWPAANTLVQIEQGRFVRHFAAWLCGHKAAWRGRWDGRLLIAGTLTHKAAGSNRYDTRHRRRARCGRICDIVICAHGGNGFSGRCGGTWPRWRSGGRSLCRRRCCLFRRSFFVRVVRLHRGRA